MSIRKTHFVNNEFYHVYNRGVDKRKIFQDPHDIRRFLKCMDEFNVIDPIGSMYLNALNKNNIKETKTSKNKKDKLVNFICFCLNPNHYHFILEQLVDDGIEKFMHRCGTSHSMYFNNKNQRTGALFQGKFKAVHVDSNEYLLHLSAYVNLNNKVHKLIGKAYQLSRSSWGEYTGENNFNFCEKGIILEQFKSLEKYKEFARSSLGDIQKRKEMREFILE